MTRRATLILAAPLLATAVPAAAQVAGAAPTRDELQRLVTPGPSATPAQLTVDAQMPATPCQLADPAYRGITLTLADVTFTGLGPVDAATLRPSYAGMLGKTVSVAALCEIRDAAAAILRRAGYVAAVSVPAQDVASGHIRLDVVIGRLVRVETSTRSHSRPLAAFLDKLLRDPVFNEKRAERYLLLARDLPGYEVVLTLRPADSVPGEMVGVVDVVRRRGTMTVGLQNLGSHDVGRWGFLASGEVNDLIGRGDRLSLGIFDTLQPGEQTVVQAGYEMRLGGEGLTLFGRATRAWTRPSLDGSDLLRSRTLVGTLGATYPFVRSRGLTLRGSAGIDLIDQTLDYGGFALLRDRLRVAFLRADFDLSRGSVDDRLPRWRVAGTIEARKGLDILDAAPDCSRPFSSACPSPFIVRSLSGKPTATVLRAGGTVEYRPTPKVTFSMSPRLQYAFDPLASYEQYAIGAYTIGRGYDPGVVSGDSGAGAAFEARRAFTAGRAAIEPYAFLDAAWIWNRRDRGYGTDRERLVSAGGGVRVNWPDRLQLDLTIAKPLRRAGSAESAGPARALLSVSVPVGR